MSRLASPLRYPSGKACLYDLAVYFLSINNLQQRSYVEAYSGGCGLALSLLYSGHVAQIHLNDIDRSIWAFWQSILHHTDEFVGIINSTNITIEEWDRQRAIQFRKNEADVIELSFSTFFLNRTNRSGIIHSGGVIGGKAQSGDWKIDCRFNKSDLVSRIQRVSRYNNRISVYNEDAEAFMNRIGNCIPANSVMYIDSPYFKKGSQLYRNSYRNNDHERIAARLAQLKNPWFLTYDNVEAIRKLYLAYSNVELDIGYSVQTNRRGSELLVVSQGLNLPIETHTANHSSIVEVLGTGMFE